VKTPVFITGNQGKVDEFSRILGIPIKHQKLSVPEIQSLDVAEVAQHKARAAFESIQAPVIVEDTALGFTALGGLPGPLLKWFEESLGHDGLCCLLDPYEDKSAIASTAIAYFDGDTEHIFLGETVGSIAEAPCGTGFGWDPIFIPAGSDKTWGEASRAEKDADSMRMKALKKFHVWLDDAAKSASQG